ERRRVDQHWPGAQERCRAVPRAGAEPGVTKLERARASATNPATGMSCARAVGAISAAASKGSGLVVSDFRLCRSILRRWPKACWVTRSSAWRSHKSGSGRGIRLTRDDVTFGGGTNAVRDTSKRMRAWLRQPARTDTRP